MLLSSSTARLTSLTVADGGRVVFDPEGDGKIVADRVLVTDGGYVDVGAADCLFEGAAEIVLTGTSVGELVTNGPRSNLVF